MFDGKFFEICFLLVTLLHWPVNAGCIPFDDLAKECGLSYTDRIVGGKDATLGQYPWLARLGYSSIINREIHYDCGGALITKNYVLTAAHCLAKLDAGVRLVRIMLGEHNANTTEDCDVDICSDPPQIFEPKKIIVHENYGKPERQNDIALVQLNKDAKFTAWVLPLCLPQNEALTKSFVDEKADVAGWGLTDSDNDDGSAILQTVKLPILPLTHCKEIFGSIIEIGDGQLCVGGKEGQDSCAGDSGGPLMKAMSSPKGPRYFVIGIVSFGSKTCAEAETPALYSNTNYFMKWIVDQIEKN